MRRDSALQAAKARRQSWIEREAPAVDLVGRDVLEDRVAERGEHIRDTKRFRGTAPKRRKAPICWAFVMPEEGLEPPTRGL
jgi:hypothetical protein